MKRSIPLNRPQVFPSDWKDTFAGLPTPVLTEENLTRSYWMDDEFYSKYNLNVNTKALVYAVMNAFNVTSPIPEIVHKGSGSFNSVFCITFPASTADGSRFRVAARIPKKIARAPGRIESIVAMTSIAHYIKGIPAPEVYAWYPESDNPVGAPYMLMEWVDGIEPWEQWHRYTKAEKTWFMEQLVDYHVKFAEPLLFTGMGSVYFAKTDIGRDLPLDEISSYRLGPLSRGPTCTVHRGIFTWPQTTPTSLRQFWVELWQHEIDYITSTHGTDGSTTIATEDHPSQSIQEDITLGEFLKVADAVRVLIDQCELPSPEEHADLYAPSVVTTDYAFRNIKINPETRQITSFIDWDDVYVMPFLLGSRYPEDICFYEGSGERWHKTGAFSFLPIDEEGDIPEEEEVVDVKVEEVDQEVEATTNADESISDVEHDIPPPSKTPSEATGDSVSETESEDEPFEPFEPADQPLSMEPDTEDYDFPRRVRDTRLRREYEELLTGRDARFGFEGFWKMREDPLKIQHLVTHGWTEWLSKAEWIQDRAKEMHIWQAFNVK
ncbi:hypothetical protein NLJ89_g5341 [Agrocybe chaxingu]|uniref:Aminoglycoside phosphotransferase domain-containing protein n=1 Tax=Agrocybe chaxingu TaxID=84603 RepID=A0A9W8K0S5_9AGAR|nr:hypothetical protein NLJ89_g5341 [Agrocybe chaxingu]